MFVEEDPTAGGGTAGEAEAGETGRRRAEAATAAEGLSTGELERRICTLATDINAATCRWLELVAEFDRRAGHEQAGFLSCTAWLSWSCSLTPRAAREQLRVARRLTELPAIRAAFSRGRLSYSKVRALSRVATPAIEDELLEVATHATAAQLERTVRGLRAALSGGDAELARERRHLSLCWEEDGMLRVSGVLPAEEGEQLIKAVESCREALREGGGEGRGPDRADGLAGLAESFLARGAASAPGGERNQVVVHVDLERLRGAGAGRRELATADSGTSAAIGGGYVDSSTARRIACDAAVVTLVERAGEPVSVGRKTRAIPPAVARALRARDRGCRFPGCHHDRYVDAHHIRHWADGGETSVDNLVLLCRRHHRFVHEGRFRVARRDGELAFVRSDGRAVGERPPDRSPCPLPGRRRRLPVPAGEPLDLDHAVMLLAARAGPELQPATG